MGRGLAVRPKRRRPKGGWVEALVPLVDTLVLFGAGLAVCCLGFLFYGLIRGDIAIFPSSVTTGQTLSKPEQELLIRNVIYATRLFSVAVWAAVLLALARHSTNTATAWIPALSGVGVYLLVPLLVAVVLEQQGLEGNQLTQHWTATFHMTGKVLIILAVLRGIAGLVMSVVQRSSRNLSFGLEEEGAQPIKIQRRALLPACWELERCREPKGQTTCPRHSERKLCWRKKTGCLCDRKVTDVVSKGAVGWTVAEAESHLWRLVQLREAGLNPCAECEIYEEHQHYKYRLFNWLAYPAGVAVVVLALPFIHVAYKWGSQKLDYLVQNIAFLPTVKSSQALEPFVNTVTQANVEWVVIVSVVILLISFLLDMIERVIYVWKV
jgi:hypothetical protein